MNKIKVIQDPEKEVPAEVLAQAIVDISAAMKKIANSRLKRRAIVVLVKDNTSGVSIGAIQAVMDSLENLEQTYLKK